MDDGLGLFEVIVDSAVLLDKAGRIINWNAGATSLFGYSRREVLGRSINLIYDRNYPFPKLIQEIHTQQKKLWQESTVFIRKNGIKGSCKSFLCSIPPNEHHKATALLIHHNTSLFKKLEDQYRNENKVLLAQLQHMTTGFWTANAILKETLNNLEQTERRLRESEIRFHLIAQNATDVITRHHPDGRYLYASPSSVTAIGHTPEELFGKNIFKMIHHDDHKKMRKAFARRRDDSDSKPIIYRVRKKNGEFRWFESNVRVIIDDQTRFVSEVQLASRDVTDRVLDKKARLRGQQLAHVFRLSTMEEMASGMAHEISQPLAAIVNYTRGCIRHLESSQHDKDELRDVMVKAARQAERAGEIIQRLKNFFCKGQLVRTPCKINNLVRETVNLIKNELTVSKTKMEFDLDKNTPFIFIDKIQMQQVLLNLIQNAIESMQENHTNEKRVHIQSRIIQNETVELTITDTGPGFSKEIINKVFMPFFTTKANGRGMGLAICRSIIEAHGGQFTINPNNASNHSWIRFSVPISHAQEH